MTTIEVLRDQAGDLWALTSDGRLWLAVDGGPWEGPATRTIDTVQKRWGPLTPLPDQDAAPHRAALAELIARLYNPAGPTK
jgi:hypothetical protein